MPRSRRGFQLQQFLPGNIVPSTASKPTGVVPESPLSLGSMQSPPFSAGGSQGSQFQQQMALNKQTQIQGISGPQAGTPTSMGSKFADLQKALGGISLTSGKSLGGGQTMASSLLGADAGSTDWASLFGNNSANSALIAAALKNLGITKPSGGLGATNSFSQDWMKQMGLV